MPQSPYSLYKFSDQLCWHLAKLLIPVWATALSWYMSLIFANIDAPCIVDVAPRLKVDVFDLPSWIVSIVSRRARINQVTLLDVFVMPCATMLFCLSMRNWGNLYLVDFSPTCNVKNGLKYFSVDDGSGSFVDSASMLALLKNIFVVIW